MTSKISSLQNKIEFSNFKSVDDISKLLLKISLNLCTTKYRIMPETFGCRLNFCFRTTCSHTIWTVLFNLLEIISFLNFSLNSCFSRENWIFFVSCLTSFVWTFFLLLCLLSRLNYQTIILYLCWQFDESSVANYLR